MTMTKTNKEVSEKIISLLAEHIGVETDELDLADSLQEDIHMSITDLADFMGKLSEEGFDTENLDLGEIESIEDLIENLAAEEDIN